MWDVWTIHQCECCPTYVNRLRSLADEYRMVEGLIVSYAELSLSGNHARCFMFQKPVRICNNEHGVVKTITVSQRRNVFDFMEYSQRNKLVFIPALRLHGY